MGFREYIKELSDEMKIRTEDIESTLVGAVSSFERIIRALEYSNPKDIPDIIKKARKEYQNVRKSLDDAFKKMEKWG